MAPQDGQAGRSAKPEKLRKPRRPWSLVRRLIGGVALIAVFAFAAQAVVLWLWLSPLADDMAALAAEQAVAAQAALQAVPAAQRPALAAQLSAGKVRVSAEAPPGVDQLPQLQAPSVQGGASLQGELGPIIEVRFQGQVGQTLAAVFRMPVDDELWWLSREYSAAQGAISGTLMVWLLVLAVATVGALLVSVRLIARPISRLAEEIAQQTSQHHGQLRPLPERADASAELQALVRAFNDLAEQVSTAAQARQQLLAGVSHDLRTPLARLRLRAETQCEPAVAEALTADLHALGRIVDQFLAYVQGDTGVTLGAPEPLDRTVRDVVLRYAATGQAVSARIEPLAVPAPELAVQRLLGNLIDNALAYGQEPVEVSLQASAEGVELRVMDHGLGLSQEDFERAQQPFVRLTQARSELGHCGLGLAIAAQMARQLGGRLSTLRDDEGRFAIALSLPLPATGNAT
jgi:two-component system osmolarity sensor histidine kinase EnvZ